MEKLFEKLKALIYSFSLFLLGAGFCMLVGWELRSGFAAGSFGGVTFAEKKGVFTFFIAIQIFIGLIFISNSIKFFFEKFISEKTFNNLKSKDNFIKTLAFLTLFKTFFMLVIGALGLWAFVEFAIPLFGEFLNYHDLFEKIATLVLAVLVLLTIIVLLYQFIIEPAVRNLLPDLKKAINLMRNKKND